MWCADLAGSPQCVIAASLKTSLNGWCCSRRFQKEQLRCVFGCGSKQDCIEHYLRCSCVELLWQQLLQEDWGEFESRLAVGCADINGRVRRAFFLYALFCAYNHFRHKEGGFDFGICRSMMQFKLGVAAGRASLEVQRLLSSHAVNAECRRTPANEELTVGHYICRWNCKRPWMDSTGGKRPRADGKRLKHRR